MKNRPLTWGFLLVILAVFLYRQSGGMSFPELPVEDGTTIVLYGTIRDIRISGESQQIYLSKVGIPSQSNFHRQVLAYSNHSKELKIGYQIRAEGTYQTLLAASNPGQFDQKAYYEAQGIGFILKDAKIQVLKENIDYVSQALHEIRMYFLGIYQNIADQETAAIFSAMILGEKDLLSKEQERNYREGGISHILAISGLHISLVGMSVYRFLRKIKQNYGISVLISGSFMISYGIMVGFGVSTRRAIFMFLIYLGAEFFGESYDLVSSFSLAGILILLREPAQLFQCGFQLSFLSVGAIGIVYPLIKQAVPPKLRVREGLCMGISVTLFTLPCTLYWFYEYMPYSIFLNLLVIPLVPGIFLSGAMGAVLGSVRLFFGEAAAVLGVLLVRFFDLLISVTKILPGNVQIIGRPSVFRIITYYVFLFVAFMVIRRPEKRNNVLKSSLLMVMSIVFLTIRLTVSGEITFLDVGQGDCIFIRTPGGSELLVDGGSTTISKVGEYRILPFLKERGVENLEAVFLTHLDEDHINGIREILKINEVEIKKLFIPDIGLERSGEELFTLAEEKGVEIGLVAKGDFFREKNFRLSCLFPQAGEASGDSNEKSLVLMAEIYDKKILLTGDLEGEGEEALLKNKELTMVDGLKVAHHGSKNATGEEFLVRTKPQFAVISCGKENTYGHPSGEVVERLKKMNCHIYYTMENGAVAVKIYKKSMRIRVEIPDKLR